MNNKKIKAAGFRPQKNQEWRQYEKGSLLENGLALNETATFIWNLCDGKKSINEIVVEVEKIYEIDQKKAKSDVVACLDILIDEGGLV